MFTSAKEGPFQVLPHLFDSNVPENMKLIAESFIPEYSNILNAIVGATYIAKNCDLVETSKMAKYLLSHDTHKKFPVYLD